MYTLHAVVVKKPKTLEEAKEIAKHFIKKNKNYHRETKSSYRFRAHPKGQFEPGSFRTQRLDKTTSLIWGKHKSKKDEVVRGGSLWSDMVDKIGMFFLRNNPLSWGIQHAISNVKSDRAARA